MKNEAMIRKLEISKYRGIQALSWQPEAGVNIIIGGGDVGKTTILDAIGLLFSPTNSVVVSESDFFARDNSNPFCIEAVISLPPSTGIDTQAIFAWPWGWDGNNAVELAPMEEDGGDIIAPDDPVYKVRVTGTADMELLWEIVQPSEQFSPFSVSLRRNIGLLKLSADDRSDRDLRLVFGSALDRLLADSALRSRIAHQISEIDLNTALGEEGSKTLTELDTRLIKAALPSELSLGLTTSQGLSIGALIGLLAGTAGVSIPLTNWGAGTRRLAALEIAGSTKQHASVQTIDEIERGLEPYRLRKLVNYIVSSKVQSFVTTHSPVAIECGTNADLWYVDVSGKIGKLERAKIENQQKRDPETFLSKVAVICEGITEVGFMDCILHKAFPATPLDYGVRVCDGGGNECTLNLLEALAKGGLLFAGIADNEGLFSGRWSSLKEKLGDNLLQWKGGCTEEMVLGAISDDNLPKLLLSEDGEPLGERLRTLADRLGIQDKGMDSINEALAAQNLTLRQVIIGAATGNKKGAPADQAKAWKSHGRKWYKYYEGGFELAETMFSLGAWDKLKPTLLPLVNAILKASELDPLETLEV